jgi:hypothetical protein
MEHNFIYRDDHSRVRCKKMKVELNVIKGYGTCAECGELRALYVNPVAPSIAPRNPMETSIEEDVEVLKVALCDVCADDAARLMAETKKELKRRLHAEKHPSRTFGCGECIARDGW